MATLNFTRVILSGSPSVNGSPIQITGTGSGSANTIHTAVSGSSAWDEVYLYITNTSGSAATLTIGVGGTGTANLVASALSIPANSNAIPFGGVIIINQGIVVSAWAGTGSVINISGYVNRIS